VYLIATFFWFIAAYFGLGWLDYWWHIPQHFRLEQQVGSLRPLFLEPPMLFTGTVGLIVCLPASRASRLAVAALSALPAIVAVLSVWNERHLRFADDSAYIHGVVCYSWLLMLALAAPIIALAAVRLRKERVPAGPALYWALVWLSGPLVFAANSWSRG
jgi:hypothetical protein